MYTDGSYDLRSFDLRESDLMPSDLTNPNEAQALLDQIAADPTIPKRRASEESK